MRGQEEEEEEEEELNSVEGGGGSISEEDLHELGRSRRRGVEKRRRFEEDIEEVVSNVVKVEVTAEKSKDRRAELAKLWSLRQARVSSRLAKGRRAGRAGRRKAERQRALWGAFRNGLDPRWVPTPP